MSKFKLTEENKYSENIMNAIKSGDEKEIQKAFDEFNSNLVETIRNDFEELKESNDKAILLQRGYRTLTSQENKFYESFIEGSKSTNPQQALTDLITKGGMPETIFEDVYRNIKQEHELLNKIQFKYVKYLTKWLLNKNPEDKAIWGEINSEITKQIEGGFDEVSLTLGKLSAFVIISKDMLELGPEFLHNYIITILKEAISNGLEYGIVKGKGVKGEPIGLIRDIHNGVSVNSNTGYPEKPKVAVKSLDIASYTTLIAEQIAKTEDDKIKNLTQVQLLVNPIDYLTKIIPATTVQGSDGTYKNDLFPFPTEVIRTKALDEGEAVLCVLPEYFFGIGNDKNASLEYSDEVKFLEDKRAYKMKMFGFGRAVDNKSAAFLNITSLAPTYTTVNVNEVKNVVKTKAS